MPLRPPTLTERLDRVARLIERNFVRLDATWPGTRADDVIRRRLARLMAERRRLYTRRNWRIGRGLDI